MTVPSPRLRRSGLFSAKTRGGPTSSMTRSIWNQSPERSPASPSPLPIALMSWQGNPPVTTSIRPLHGLPSKVQMSSQIGNRSSTPSRCRCNRISLGKGLISTAATVVQPSSFEARTPPPAPAKHANSRNSGLCPPVTCSQWIMSPHPSLFSTMNREAAPRAKARSS
jgi:hypothetical protein